ncbi:GmrSD restriction endonuclease domain-containing protein [Actinomyces provencensis]|uniref:GmrSD restriction endonuclease domain-containing protein n=1 Tax=Actinomyces provencensis TaxID=1720198 RepID=UPI00096A4903|nr:DUF262 domain-containing protein [Actinomyces provencensis]
MALSAEEQPLNRVFSRDYQFRMPVFQRPYSWGVEQALQLLDDVTESSSQSRSPYFLGSIVLLRDPSDGRVRDVIDGQQRLTTLTILLAVLRELEERADVRDGLDHMINESGQVLQGIAPGPRLELRDTDRSFFRYTVQDGDLEALFDLRGSDLTSVAQRHIFENTRALFDSLSTDRTPEERRALAVHLSNQVFLVVISTDDLASAHRVFSVLNTRGLPLTAGDILKSQIVGSLPREIQDRYSRTWDDLADSFGGSLDTFLHHVLTVRTHREAQDNLVEDFRTRVLPTIPDGGMQSFLDRVIIPLAGAMRAVTSGSCEGMGPGVADSLRRLGEFGTTDWIPVAMVIIDRWGVNSPTSADLLARLERVVGVDTVAARTRPQRRQRVVQLLDTLDALDPAGAGEAGEGGAPMGSGVQDPDARSGGFAIDDNERRRALLNLRGEVTANAPITRIVLERANEQLSTSGGPGARARTIRVVRLIPTSPSPDSSWRRLTEATREYWTNRVANMALTTQTEARIRDVDGFAERVARIVTPAVEDLGLTAELTSIREWTPEVLQRREDRIVEALADHWQIRHDSEGIDLAALGEQELLRGPGVGRGRVSRRIRTAEVVRAGLLAVGDVLVWQRASDGREYRVTVTETGGYRLPNGKVAETPSGAVRLITGESRNGLRLWRRDADGRLLGDIWKVYRQRVLGTE